MIAMMLIKRHGHASICDSHISSEDAEIIRHALAVFAFVMPWNGLFACAEWIAGIEGCFGKEASDPRTRAILLVLAKYV